MNMREEEMDVPGMQQQHTETEQDTREWEGRKNRETVSGKDGGGP
jgi:hypothetical protein